MKFKRFQNLPLLYSLSQRYKSASPYSAAIIGKYAHIRYRDYPKCGPGPVAKFVFKTFPAIDVVDFGGMVFDRNTTE